MRTLNSVSPTLTAAMRSQRRTNTFCPITGKKKPSSFLDRLFITLFLKSPSLFVTSSRDTLLWMEQFPAIQAMSLVLCHPSHGYLRVSTEIEDSHLSGIKHYYSHL